MVEFERVQHSLRRRIIVTALLTFIVCIWALSYFASQILRSDMEKLLGDQQYSTVSYVAAEINQALEERILAMENVASSIDPRTLSKPAVLQRFLDDRPILQGMFNSGIVAVSGDGIAVADAPVVPGRRGTSYANNAATHIALTEGRSVVGKAVLGRVLKQPLFNINTPIRDRSGRVIGALFGVINLAKPNFLERIGLQRYGKSGGYLVLDLQNGIVVTATDRSRALQPLPAPGTNAMIDRRRQGFFEWAVSVNTRGEEVLSAASPIPVSNWLVVAALPTKEAFAPIYSMQRHLVVAAILLTMIVSALFWWLLRRQFAPLYSAVESLARMSAPSGRVQPLPLTSLDEIGLLVSGFNQLLAKLVQHEEQLQEERDFFGALLQQASDGVLLFDPQSFRIQEANPVICRMLGYSNEELVQEKYSGLLDVHSEAATENIRRIVEDKVSMVRERAFRRKDGTLIPVEVNAGLVETGERRLIMVSVRDLTERKQTETELQRHRQHLEEMVVERTTQLRNLAAELAIAEERERRAIAQDLHDDLGQVLAMIKLRLTSLDLPAGSEQASDLSRQVQQIESLVDKANSSIRSLSMQLSPPMLRELGLIAALEWLAEEMQRSYGLKTHVYSDASQLSRDVTLNSSLYRIVRELLINVSKHAQVAAAEVAIMTERGCLVITVADGGVGFDMKDKMAPSAKGGYGLFSVKERLTYIGGDMQVDSRLGDGTTVVLTVPLPASKQA